MTEITNLSATEIVANIKNKTFSCREVMQAHLNKIQQVNPSLNAIVQLLPKDEALKEADLADKAIATNQPLGKLHGLPITIKDHIKVKNFIVTRGSMGLKNNLCMEDASIVTRLKNEGAIVIGITNMPEFGPSYESDNDIYGQTKNPYDMTKTAGGSSGGEGAIIASGGSPLGIGSDAGGSVRIPAHFCGIAGHKPTQNLLPCTGNVPMDGGLIMQVGTFGPMARFVEDLELVLPIIAGSDGIDPYTPINPFLRKSPAVKNMRVGFVYTTSVCTPTIDTIKTLENACHELERQGAQVSEVEFLDLGYLGKFMWDSFFMGGDQGKLYSVMLKNSGVTKPSKNLQLFLDIAEKSEIFDALEIKRRFFEADQLRMQALAHMQNYDVIITPVCATPAKEHGTTFDSIMDITYTLAFNLLRWPGTVVRCGTSKEGLPIGLQILAKPWDDYFTLAVAKFLEDALGGWQAP